MSGWLLNTIKIFHAAISTKKNSCNPTEIMRSSQRTSGPCWEPGLWCDDRNRTSWEDPSYTSTYPVSDCLPGGIIRMTIIMFCFLLSLPPVWALGRARHNTFIYQLTVNLPPSNLASLKHIIIILSLSLAGKSVMILKPKLIMNWTVETISIFFYLSVKHFTNTFQSPPQES